MVLNEIQVYEVIPEDGDSEYVIWHGAADYERIIEAAHLDETENISVYEARTASLGLDKSNRLYVEEANFFNCTPVYEI